MSLLGAEDEMPPALRKTANVVLVSLCDLRAARDKPLAAKNDQSIAEIIVRLYPKARASNASPGKSTTVTTLLSFVVEQCQPWCTNTVETVLKLDQATNILKALHAASTQSSVLHHIADFIRLDLVPEWWDSEATIPLSLKDRGSSNCIGEEVCPQSLDHLQFEVATSFSSLLLTAAWHSSESLQQAETCQRLLNRLKRSPSKTADPACSYSSDQSMGLEYDGALLDLQSVNEELRARLEQEKTKRMALGDQLAETRELLQQEQQASTALQQYLEAAEREGWATKQSLRQSREDYVELLQEADRKVQAVESEAIGEKLGYKAEMLGREYELEQKLDEALACVKHKDEEVQLERQQREKLEAETKVAQAHTHSKVGHVHCRSGEVAKVNTDGATESSGGREGPSLGGSRISEKEAHDTSGGAELIDLTIIKYRLRFNYDC